MLSKYTNTFFPVCSFMISLLITLMYFGRKKVKNIETDIYSNLVITGLVESSSYLLLTILVDTIYSEKLTILFELLNKGLGTIYITWMALLLFYTINIVTKDTEKVKKSKKAIIYISVIFSIIVFALPIKLWMDPVMYQSNSYGPSINFLYAAVSFYIMLLLIIVVRNRKKEEVKTKFLPLYMLFILLTASMILRMIDPLFNVTSNMLSFVLLIMFHTIENPDVKMIEQLDIAKNQAERANAAKTEFLSSMSHEIRTPLNAIVGFSDYIINSNSLEEAKENAQDIVNASQTLLEIVNGILDISKIEAGKLEIINTKYTAKTTFESLAKLITPKMQEKGLDFSYYIAPDIPETLFGDHANIKKVVTNLLSNAYKYTDKGFVRYEVNCVNSDEYTKLIITVEDSGRGIKQESVDKLFTKFQRLDEDRNTTIEGTGLGLAITKQLIELMGGKILVHTVYGEGSKFTVVLNQRIEAVPVQEEVQINATTLDLTDKRILIVDDNALNIKVATKILERYSANNITPLNDGFSCIENIKSGNIYDIILMDDMMPKMSGVETFKKLKELPGFNMPVVILTANAISGMKEKYLSEGFDDYLAKPIEKDELIRVCNTIFKKYQNITSNVQTNKEQEIVKEEVQPEIETEPVEQLEQTEELEVVTTKEEVIVEEENQVIDPIADLELVEPVTEENINELRDNSKSDEIIDPISEVQLVSPVEEIELVEPMVEVEKTETNSINEVELVEAVEPTSNPENYLRENNVDLDKALEFLGDMEMYNATVGDFLSEIKAKWHRIVEYKNTNDMPNYAIEVHSLKSDAKYLGLMSLADISYEHELKSKENDIEFVNNNFKRLEVEYTKALNIIKTYNHMIN